MEDLCYGRFYLIDVGGFWDIKKIPLPIKDVKVFRIEITNALTATQTIISEFDKHDLKDKIVLLKLFGNITQGTNADIDYKKITDYLEQKKAYSFLKNTNKLESKGEKMSEIKITSTDMNKVEEVLVKQYEISNPDKFNELITPLIHSLNMQKQEDEKTVIYETRLFSELNKILGLEIK